MEEFTSLDPEETKGEKIKTIHSIEINDMYFTFPGSLDLLKNINIEISKGKITTLLGESGVGKSTLLQIIQRFYQPNAEKFFAMVKMLKYLFWMLTELNSG